MDLRLKAARRAHRQGDRESAETLYRECLNSADAAVPAALLLAQLLGEDGRLDEAEAVLRPIQATGGPPARLLLARVASEQGRYGEVLDLLSGSAAWPPPLVAEARLLAAGAHESLGRPEEARATLRVAVEASPDHPVLWNRWGVLLHAEGEAAGAVGAFERSLALRPGHPGVTANLAAALAMAGDIEGAMTRYGEVLERHPEHRQAVTGYARLLQELGRVDEARTRVRGLLAARPDDPDVIALLAGLDQAGGDVAAAERGFTSALAINPGHTNALAGLAELMEWTGRYPEGLDLLGPGGPDDEGPVAIARARLLGRLHRNDEAAVVLENVDRKVGAEPAIRRRLAFAKGDVLDRLGRYEEAFASYSAGNALNPTRWNPAAFEPTNNVAVERPAAPAGAGAGEGVTLIVGMPRSGTTLVEQMLAAHPRVIAGGERAELGRIAMELENRAGPLTADEAGRLARVYRREPVPGGKVFTDKMPLNVLHLPLAARLLPRARVVLCRRDPRDTALSCYFTDFMDPALAFACRWDWLAEALARYRALADRWLEAPGLETHTVSYEAMVTDPRSELGALLEFLGLQWHPGCLQFHLLARTAHTASHAQVRQSVYTSSIDRWRNYEPWLPADILAM